MRRRSRGIILLVLAAWMCGLTYLVIFYPEIFLGNRAVAALEEEDILKREKTAQGESTQETETPKPKATSIAISTVDMEWGQTIGDILEKNQQSFQGKEYATDLLPEGYIPFEQLDAYKDQILMADLKSGKPLLKYKLHRNQERLIEERTEEGTRAMAVKVDDVVGVSGYIKPYSRVDVLVTLSRRKPPTTRTVLRNVLVLAAGDRVERVQASTAPGPIGAVKGEKGEQETPSKARVVTLQVSPEQAERLALASSEGALRLSLRNPLDKAEGTSKGVNLNTLLSKPSRARGVRVIKGSRIETHFVR